MKTTLLIYALFALATRFHDYNKRNSVAHVSNVCGYHKFLLDSGDNQYKRTKVIILAILNELHMVKNR